MRNSTIVGTLTLLLALCAAPCFAQDRDRQDNIPRGDYVQTCRNIQMEGDRLVAECQERDGNWRRSSLDDASRCRGEIHNIDGNLTCGGGDDGDRPDRRRNWQNGLPPGDYLQTCRNIGMTGNRLDAECQRRNGGWRRSSINDVDQCSGPITNDNGNLVCPQGGPGNGNGDRDNSRDRIPPGTYTQTCRNIRVEGDRLLAECQGRDGDWRQTALDDFRRCTAAPANDNGRLVCPRDNDGDNNGNGNGYRFGWRDGLPAGDYTQSCRNIRAKGYALAAECQTRSGGWRNSSLFNFDQCTGAIANDDGHLVCPK
ncbi:MAG TPA: CVNH domain-containing protein [Candidatus Angelobacter sp.]